MSTRKPYRTHFKVSKKFELVGEPKAFYGTKLRRIRALRSFPGVKAGDLGGYVETEKNLDQRGSAWIFDDGKSYDDAVVTGSAQVRDKARVFGRARIGGKVVVTGKAALGGDAAVMGEAKVVEPEQLVA